jgi:hypothetical protein
MYITALLLHNKGTRTRRITAVLYRIFFYGGVWGMEERKELRNFSYHLE